MIAETADLWLGAVALASLVFAIASVAFAVGVIRLGRSGRFRMTGWIWALGSAGLSLALWLVIEASPYAAEVFTPVAKGAVFLNS